MPCMRMLCDAAPTPYSMCMEVYQEATSAIYSDRHRFFVGMVDMVLRSTDPMLNSCRKNSIFSRVDLEIFTPLLTVSAVK